MSIINNFNENLKNLKLLFFQPVIFLLFVGKRFKHLETLEVGFLSNTIHHINDIQYSIKPSKYFDKLLNDTNLDTFRNLKSFSFTTCIYIQYPDPLVLKTILLILKGCQDTLTSFEFVDYKGDVKELIDFICFKNIPLKYLKFKLIAFLTKADIMKILKRKNNNDLLINIEQCPCISSYYMQIIKDYIKQNSLKIKTIYKDF